MNAIASFAPVLTLSLGSLGYLVGGQLLERTRISALFALILIGAAGYLSLGLLPAQSYLEHALIITPFTRFFAVLACAGAFVSILGTASSIESEKIEMLSEYYFLMVTSLCGALVMIFAGDLLTLFIWVEVASLALYCLCGARVTVRRAAAPSGTRLAVVAAAAGRGGGNAARASRAPARPRRCNMIAVAPFGFTGRRDPRPDPESPGPAARRLTHVPRGLPAHPGVVGEARGMLCAI